jgi:HlyD family secretion protein
MKLMRWFWRHSRILVALVVVAVIVALAVWPKAVEVDAVRVGRGPLLVTLDEEGETRVRDRYVITAPVAGKLARIQLEPGDRVVEGQTLLAELQPAASPLLDPRTRSELSAAASAAQAALGQARAERARGEAEVARARSTLRRSQQLLAENAIAPDEVEAQATALASAEEALHAAEFAVQRTQSELELARARLGAPGAGGRNVAIVAPASGVVLRLFHESETLVAASERLLEIGDPTRTEVVADLLSSDAVRVPPQARVAIEEWGGGRTLEGRVRRVEPSGFTKVSALGVEEQRVNVIIDWSDGSAAETALGDGYRVEVRIVLWEQADVVKVPIGSLFRRGEDWAAFSVEEGRARLLEVEIGQRSPNEGQVLDGLAEQQTVIVHPPDSLSDGMRVRVRPR